MARRSEPDLHGLIVVDKPQHLTSHDVVARIRRMTSIRRVGHAGTLDPFATGVVVVAVGRATRVLQFVQDTDKTYLAHIVLGAETDSCDVDGVVVARSSRETWPEHQELEAALGQLVGTIEQQPPVYSAIKVGGQPLHRQARAGKDVIAPMRTVTVHSIDLISYDPPDVVVLIRCGKGTYVRAIARDLGSALDTSGYCHGLRRLATGQFGIDQAWTLEELQERDPYENWHDIAVHPDFALVDLPALVMSESALVSWYHGQSAEMTAAGPEVGSLMRVYGPGGEFAGIGIVTAGQIIKPRHVFTVTEVDSSG